MLDDWHGNYFNYFTEVEEHFQKARFKRPKGSL